MYLFGFVGMLVLVDIMFMIPPTAISSAKLQRDQKEIEGNNVRVASYHMIALCITFYVL